jgi:RNA polymerase sigma-70 factor (ECF subfamily)
MERHAGDANAAGIGAAPRDPIRHAEARELGTLLREAIDRLPEGRRTAVLLRWVHEMSYAEIAHVMGTSVIGVKQQLNRGLRELRATLPQFLR